MNRAAFALVQIGNFQFKALYCLDHLFFIEKFDRLLYSVEMLIRLILCVLILAGFLYAFINQQNQVVTLRLQIPTLQKEVAKLEQENVHLQFQIDQFESPTHLIELKKKPQYSHLKEPLEDAILTLPNHA